MPEVCPDWKEGVTTIKVSLAIKIKIMKKNVKDFMKYLEKETDIEVDLETISPTQRITNSLNNPIHVNVVGINQGTLGMAVFSCGCRNCKNLTGIEILFGQNGSELHDAEIVKNMIKSVVPTIPVEIRLVN